MSETIGQVWERSTETERKGLAQKIRDMLKLEPQEPADEGHPSSVTTPPPVETMTAEQEQEYLSLKAKEASLLAGNRSIYDGIILSVVEDHVRNGRIKAAQQDVACEEFTLSLGEPEKLYRETSALLEVQDKGFEAYADTFKAVVEERIKDSPFARFLEQNQSGIGTDQTVLDEGSEPAAGELTSIQLDKAIKKRMKETPRPGMTYRDVADEIKEEMGITDLEQV